MGYNSVFKGLIYFKIKKYMSSVYGKIQLVFEKDFFEHQLYFSIHRHIFFDFMIY